MASWIKRYPMMSKHSKRSSPNSKKRSPQNRSTIDRLQQKNSELTEQLQLLLHKQFGSKSEQEKPQNRDFVEAEAATDENALADIEASASEDDEPEALETEQPQGKRGRKPINAALPRIEAHHDIAETQKRCPHDGSELKCIGETVSEQLDIIPAKVQVIRHIRYKYGS